MMLATGVPGVVAGLMLEPVHDSSAPRATMSASRSARSPPARQVGGRGRGADEIPLAHKVALHADRRRARRCASSACRSAGATRDIAQGELVHVHNVASDYLVNDVDHFEE